MNKIIHYSFIIRHEYRLYEYEYEYRIPYEYEYEYELVFMNYSLFIVQVLGLWAVTATEHIK